MLAYSQTGQASEKRMMFVTAVFSLSFLIQAHRILFLTDSCIRLNQGCGVAVKMSDSDSSLSKISNPDFSNISDSLT